MDETVKKNIYLESITIDGLRVALCEAHELIRLAAPEPLSLAFVDAAGTLQRLDAPPVE